MLKAHLLIIWNAVAINLFFISRIHTALLDVYKRQEKKIKEIDSNNNYFNIEVKPYEIMTVGIAK